MSSKFIFSIAILTALISNAVTATEPEPYANEWRGYIELLAPAGETIVKHLPDPDDRELRYEVYRRLMSEISRAYLGLFTGDAEHPDFWPVFNGAFTVGSANPDDSYYMAALAGQGVYRISGVRGKVRLVDFQTGTGEFYTKGKGAWAPTFDTYDLDKLDIEENGTFEVILSEKKPEKYEGNWWHLNPASTYVMVRQIAYDWHAEDGRFAIERLDTPAMRPRLTPEQIDTNLRQVSEWIVTYTLSTLNFINTYKDKGWINKISVNDLSSLGGHSGQVYIQGLYDIAPDEALIYETTVPKECRYWSIQLTDRLWHSLDHMNRQSSLNGHQAKLDSDGKFRAVVSMQDPGVANWLDTVGNTRGSFFGRWTHCSGQPVPTLTKVKFTDIDDYLPKNTARLTAEQRDKAIRYRREGAQLRRRW
ncbi:MAG: hypothetical protein ACI9FD_000887 [Gammaproteobacteria bacterium]|jgi:hypothetical protein